MTTVTLRPTGSSIPNPIGNSVVGPINAANMHAAVSDDSDTSRFDGYASTTPGTYDYGYYTSAVHFTFAALPSGAVVTSTGVRNRSAASGMGVFANVYINQTYPARVQSSWYPASGSPTTSSTTTSTNAYPASGSIPEVQVFGYSGNGYISVHELWLDLTYYTAPNTPTSLSAANVTTTPRPTFTWTHNGGTSSGPQNAFQVRVFTLAQATIGGFDPETSPYTLDSGVIGSATSTWLPTSDLSNGVTYRAYVRTYNGGSVGGVPVNTAASPWSAYHQFAIAIPVPVPTALTPVNSAVSTTSRPALGASVAAMSGGVQIKREWTIASNTGFSTNVTTVIEDTLSTTKSGTYSFPVLPARLAQGTWYVRVRTVDSFGVTSAWTSYNTFTVAHAPSSSNRSPGSAAPVVYAGTRQVTWTFSDPDPEDYQLKYEAELWKLSAPGSPIQSGVVTNGTGAHTFTIPDTTWKGVELRWRVKTTDQDNVAGAWSPDQSFFLYDLPVGALTFPTEAQVITTAQPTFTWTFTAAGRTQASYRVVVTKVSDSSVVADSGVVAGTALSWQLPSPLILVSTNYSVTLTVVDSVGMSNTDTNAFTATYSAPTTPVFTVNTSEFSSLGRNFIDWTTAVVDGTNLGWRVFRREASDPSWTMIAETDTATKTFYDYLAPAMTDLEYSVVQVAESFGAPVESAYPTVDFYGDCDYMLVCPEDDSLNMPLYHVTSDDFEDEQEMATQNLIGRGRRVEYGTRFGQTGSLSAEFRDQSGGLTGRQQRLALEALRNSGLKVYLRNPFGDVWAVALQSARLARTPGVGKQEMATATISYTEITA